jgi:hypothetical protein
MEAPKAKKGANVALKHASGILKAIAKKCNTIKRKAVKKAKKMLIEGKPRLAKKIVLKAKVKFAVCKDQAKLRKCVIAGAKKVGKVMKKSLKKATKAKKAGKSLKKSY